MKKPRVLPTVSIAVATTLTFQAGGWSEEPYDTLKEMGVDFTEREFYSGDTPDGFGKGEFAVVRDSDRFDLQAAIPHLSQVKSLVGLSLERCSKISNLESIQELSTLKALNIMQCEALQSLSELKGHPSIESLDVGDSNAIKDAKGVANLPKLVHLEFANCKSLLHVNDATNLPNLRSLAMEACSSFIPTGLRSVPTLKNLETISVSDMLIQDLVWLRGLRKLTHLHIRGCSKLTSLQGLESLTALEVLELQGAPVTQASQLTSLKRLESLTMMSTKVQTLDGLKGLAGLRDVSLHQNPVLASVNGLRGLKQLERLQIDSCPALKSLDPLKNSPSLKLLRIPNQLATKPVISTLNRLEVLALDGASSEQVASVREWAPKTEVVSTKSGGDALARFFGELSK